MEHRPTGETAPIDSIKTTLPKYRPSQIAKLPPCQAACPVSGDIRRWVGTVAQREQLGLDETEAYREAWRIITDLNPFPATLGRICPHPCEAGCNRNDVDAPVAINSLERFLGDWAIENQLGFDALAPSLRSESIGVIGAGPSGLSFAYQMARRGYAVTIYEKQDRPGGMLRYGVPDYRLPPHVLNAEIERICRLGVELKLGVAVGKDISVDDLRDRHDLLYVGIGAQQGRPLGVPGDEGPGVHIGVEYLGHVNRGGDPYLGSTVAVIGGGNTAVDAARVVRRSGAEVLMLYRRTRAEMPAVDAEVEEAVEEGIDLRFLVAPVEVNRLNGAVESLIVRNMQLGEPDASGRRRPEPIDASEHEIRVDAVVAAISQEPDWSSLTELEPESREREMAEVADGVWLGGDAAGPGIAGIAIAHGRAAAEVAHARLTGFAAEAGSPPEPVDVNEVKLDYRPTRSRAVSSRLAVEDGLAAVDLEVNLGIDEEAFLSEVQRCSSCGLCFGCSHCFMYCTVGSFTAVENPSPGEYFVMNLDHCTECGKCIEVCPCGFLEVTSTRH
jgi:formate dehydrogenase major subunit